MATTGSCVTVFLELHTWGSRIPAAKQLTCRPPFQSAALCMYVNSRYRVDALRIATYHHRPASEERGYYLDSSLCDAAAPPETG